MEWAYQVMCARTGRDPERFWTLTPRRYLVELMANAEAARDRRESSISRAWLTALLTRADKLPDLDSLLNPPPPPTIEDAIRDLRAGAEKRSWKQWLGK